MGLHHYRRKRPSRTGPRFVIQHHPAGDDQYDFCLEIDGVLVSWAIPKAHSANPQDGRIARRTDEAGYAEGSASVWDRGTYANRTQHEMTTCLSRGHLSFHLEGKKLRGRYALTRIREGDNETWLLMKRQDDDADTLRNALRAEPEWVPPEPE
jgi:DNA ligase D-like protein (predicted 3'-phosphoesterase)